MHITFPQPPSLGLLYYTTIWVAKYYRHLYIVLNVQLEFIQKNPNKLNMAYLCFIVPQFTVKSAFVYRAL